ncbi:MAG: hypothetical protein M1829_004733 [Trizodia sp. TS-e1964]|nr:MAG: hypothetical protein M1829_004733 [Trizodia sp. TS-e1964]
MSYSGCAVRPISSCCKNAFLRPRQRKLLDRQLSTASAQVSTGRPPPPFRRQAPKFLPSQSSDDNPYVPRKIKTYAPPPSALRRHPHAIEIITAAQIKVLDPTGLRTKLFERESKEAAHVGDILLVTLKSGDPFAGVCLNIRQRGVDTAILLRNQLTRIGVEMWFKIYSPNIEGIEIVQRKEKRARRARLYYLRKPKHDMGSVQGVVQQHIRRRNAGALGEGNEGEHGPSHRNKKGRKKR